MNIDEYCQAMQERVLAFHETWLKGQKADPQGYPAELEDAEWFEQFLAFLENPQ